MDAQDRRKGWFQQQWSPTAAVRAGDGSPAAGDSVSGFGVSRRIERFLSTLQRTSEYAKLQSCCGCRVPAWPPFAVGNQGCLAARTAITGGLIYISE